ncbi:unnamed protein product [Anisakis simplex]|uniref:Uncharacterized protein n=1 Tax=Anisakis simplex TaxID=6269 RepID=A0A0M3J5E9_ANISI|nr:unnamed protein product [Anisakis simplex]
MEVTIVQGRWVLHKAPARNRNKAQDLHRGITLCIHHRRSQPVLLQLDKVVHHLKCNPCKIRLLWVCEWTVLLPHRRVQHTVIFEYSSLICVFSDSFPC